MLAKTPLLIASLACAAALSGCNGQRAHSTIGEPETPAMISAQIDKAASLVRDAQRLELAGRDKEAEAKYQLAIQTYRELPAAWNNLGRLMMKSGTNLAAAEAFKTASELAPTDPVSVTNLGVLWETLGYLDDAARWYEEALKRNENHLPALRRMLVVEESRNKPDQITLEHIRRALMVEKDPWWAERFQRARGRFEQMVNDTKTDAMSRPDLMGLPPRPQYTPPQTMPSSPGASGPAGIPITPAPAPRTAPSSGSAYPPPTPTAEPASGTSATGVSPAWPE
jgi:tetratricopeptide (TPR) repeat protein